MNYHLERYSKFRFFAITLGNRGICIFLSSISTHSSNIFLKLQYHIWLTKNQHLWKKVFTQLYFKGDNRSVAETSAIQLCGMEYFLVYYMEGARKLFILQIVVHAKQQKLMKLLQESLQRQSRFMGPMQKSFLNHNMHKLQLHSLALHWPSLWAIQLKSVKIKVLSNLRVACSQWKAGCE